VSLIGRYLVTRGTQRRDYLFSSKWLLAISRKLLSAQEPRTSQIDRPMREPTLPAMRFVLVVLLLQCRVLSAAVFIAPDDTPTADEVAILEYLNRFRADPGAEAARILADEHLPVFFWRGVDKALFKAEMAALPKVPPVVFDLDALRAARRHSYYMVHNGLGHGEVPGKEGFSGADFSARMQAAGFTGSERGENCFAAANNAWQSHVGFLIDFGPGGTGGMQAGRGHRTIMASPGSNVVGAGAVANGQQLSVTHNFGKITKRFAGGAMYSDRNGNGQFDPGEGRGGVIVRSGKYETRTWASGGYVLAIDSAAPAIIAAFGQLVSSAQVGAGNDQVHFSWSIPLSADGDICDALVLAVEKFPAQDRLSGRGWKAVVNLAIQSTSLSLDDARAATVAELSGTVHAELAEHRQALLDALTANNGTQLTEAVKAGRKWRGTAAQAWFDSADLLIKATAGVQKFNSATDKSAPLLAALQQAKSQAPPDLAVFYVALIQRLAP